MEHKHWYVYSWMPNPQTPKERRLPIVSQPRNVFASRVVLAQNKKGARVKFLAATNEAGRCITIRLAKPGEVAGATILV